MNFEELGLTLKREREKKGLSIERVMEATKISRSNITAMEAGDRSAMPHPVYAKGFVKSYARYLGLDADELSMVVDREFQEEGEFPEEFGYDVAPQAEKAFQEPSIVEGKKKNHWPLFLVVVLLVGVITLLVVNFTGNRPEEAEVVVAEETIEEVQPSVEEEPESAQVASGTEDDASVEMTDEAVGDNGEQGDEMAVAPDQPEANQPDAVQPEAVPESEPEPEQPAEAVSPAPEPVEEEAAQKQEEPKYDHMLVIRATTDKGCWIGVWKGDETDMYRDFVLKNGEPLRLNFNTPRRIRIGNASGVTVTYNGESYELDPARGNIQTHRFGY